MQRKPETRNRKPETRTCQVYPCPHCRTQNFATGARLRQAERIPLTCWKCGEEIHKPMQRLGGGGPRRKDSGGRQEK